MCTRATAPLCVYPCFCYRSCRRRSCQCGLHKQAARAKVARSSAQPKGLRSASRRQSRRSCSASRPGRRARSRPHRTARRRPVRLAPSSGSPQAVCLRTAPSPLRSLALPPRSFRGLRKPPPGSCSAGGDEREERIGCREERGHGIIGLSEIKTRPRRVVGVRAPPVSNLPPWLSLLRVALT